MADIRVPTLGESVTEATVGKWFKQPGDAVAVDEPLDELETDKVTLEVPAPAAAFSAMSPPRTVKPSELARCSAGSRKVPEPRQRNRLLPPPGPPRRRRRPHP